MRILIVDDEPTVANVLADAVESAGHLPIVAHSGVDSLAAIDAEQPEAVFLDVVMPGLSGVDVLREIRQRYPDLPVVIVTGQAGNPDVDEAQRLGVADVVEKPWVLMHLGEALEGLQTKTRA